jgi:hypothetical protein
MTQTPKQKVNRIDKVKECDPSKNSGQAATQLPNSEKKLERSVATGDDQNY